jgi:hypothetical protein
VTEKLTKKEILKKKGAIEEYVQVSKDRLEKYTLEGDELGIATAIYLINEYEEMLEEFCNYYKV